MPTVVLAGTLDTKGLEYAFVQSRLREVHRVDTLLVDVGILGSPAIAADITREEVARAAGADIATLAAANDRGAGIETMCAGLCAIVRRLHAEGRLDGILGLGGSGGTSLITRAMRELPVGVPKLMVSTVASGDTRAYVGASDVTLMYSVIDISGINSVSAPILANAAAAIAGMATAPKPIAAAHKPLVGATMFGVTTAGVTRARQRLEELGYEVLVFHATGSGGQSMEALVRDGFVSAVLDVTTTELADEIGGGVFSAGPDRLEIAGERGVPQVVSVGALDMINFGPFESVPERFAARQFVRHNATITLMRTTPEQNAELGRIIARKVSAAHGPVTVFLPLRGVSALDVAGMPFHDPVADAALFDAIRSGIGPNVGLREIDTDINDPAYAVAMADELHALVTASTPQTAMR